MSELESNLVRRKARCVCCDWDAHKANVWGWIQLSYAGVSDDVEAVGHDVHEQDGVLALSSWIKQELPNGWRSNSLVVNPLRVRPVPGQQYHALRAGYWDRFKNRAQGCPFRRLSLIESSVSGDAAL